MIAKSILPARWALWNARTGAPCWGPFAQYPLLRSTRIWEYPWAWEAGAPAPGMRALDVGGGMCGFARVLASHGLQVTVADPDIQQNPPEIARGWGVDLVNTTAENLDRPPGSFDVAFCLSVIEHIADASARSALMAGVFRLLRPGGAFIVTVDLFLDLHPFGAPDRREDAQNVPIPSLLAAAPFQLETGLPAELYGCPGFSAPSIIDRARAGELLIGAGGVLSQCLVLRRPDS